MAGRGPVLLFGCGSIGRRHAENLRRLGRDVAAYDTSPERRAWMRRLGCATPATPAEGWRLSPSAAWICTPPSSHAALALEAVRRRVPAFIEKPLAHTLADGRAIARAAAAARVPVAVGYQLRLHPALAWLKRAVAARRWGRILFARAEMGQFLPDWRPWQDYRESYTARRGLGGGILLDASHELDLVRWLAGEPKRVVCAAGKLSGLALDVEDTAAMIMELEGGGLAEVHLDMVQRGYRRLLHLAFQRAVVVFELASSEVKVWTGPGKPRVRRFRADLNHCYLEEARLLLAGRPAVGAADALRTLETALAARRSAKARRWLSLTRGRSAG